MKGEPKLRGLKELRVAANLTQEGLADRLGVSSRQVTRWETEDVGPRTSSLERRICDVLGCTRSQLYGYGLSDAA
jgi:transcriptional regulator with XRE-family HTH domain